MRWYALILAFAFLTGCRSTRIVDADWNDEYLISRVNTIAATNDFRAHLPTKGWLALSKMTVDGDTVSGLLNRRSSRIRITLPTSQVIRDSVSQKTIIKLSTNQVSELQYVERPGRGTGFLAGVGIGLVAGFLVGVADGDDKSGLVRFSAGQKGVVLGILFAPLGGLIGLMTGSPDYVVYRFNSREPNELKVVLGGPSSTSLATPP